MKKLCLSLLLILPLQACTHHEPMATVDYVDIDRFMGDWYVVANIPTFIEEGAHNAVESYSKASDGTIATTFTFNADSFDGERKEYHPTGYIKDTNTNALWGMQFIWPFKADFRVVYLDKDYTKTVIAREARDYVWIMARTPNIPDKDYQEIVSFIESIGYDVSKLQRVPQSWAESSSKPLQSKESL